MALSRALGDFDFKKNTNLPPEEQAVTAFPEVTERTIIDSDEFVIIACDGFDGAWIIVCCCFMTTYHCGF